MNDKNNTSYFANGQFIVKEKIHLNFFDITGSKAKTKGTSNKQYYMEIDESNDGRAQIHFSYGPTGGRQTIFWRLFSNYLTAKTEFDKIIKSKKKKGYVEIDVAQSVIGSDEAQKQTKAVVLKNAEALSKAPKSILTSAQKSIVSLFFNAQDTWVAKTLKCPLGQLTNQQIDLGREALDKAKLIVNAVSASNKSLTKSQLEKVEELTNDFYGLIPHNLGSGARGQMTHLRLDTLDKIVEKESDLDTLLDAKQVGAVLKADSTLDDKYKSLNCDFEEIDMQSELGQFLSSYFVETKVSGHGYHGARVSRIWSMRRHGSKEAAFFSNAERIAREAGKHTFSTNTSSLSGGKSKLWVPEKRPDLDKEQVKLYNKANVWLCWHGTRSANLVGITRRGLLVRPTGAVHTGSMFGDARYYAWQSSKSLNYCDGGYWTGGHQSNKKYMFLMDVALGNMFIAPGPKFYKSPPKGYHSVYGKAHHSGVRNDEMMTYDILDKDNQATFQYLFEIV